MKDFSHLKKNLKKDFSAFPKVKLALLGDTATQFLNQALRGTAYERQIDPLKNLEKLVFKVAALVFIHASYFLNSMF